LLFICGGPGVLFWIWLTSILCATSAFSETVLAVVFRKKDLKNIYRGGPFYYIKEGMGNRKLATIYAVFVLFAYIGGFMTIQVNTVTKSITDMININPLFVGIIIAILTGITIIGGVKKIANITGKVVPFMTLCYFFICIYIIIVNKELIPEILGSIIHSAFNIKTFGWGILSTLLIGMQKGIFSSEVGLGTGAIASVTADTKSSAKNGLVQTFGIHFENILIATITTFIICMSNYQGLVINDPNGIEITLYAFEYHMGNLGAPVTVFTITLFGLATVLTGYYYSESSLKFIKKTNKFDIIILKIVTIVIVILGSIVSSQILWDITDIMVGILAIINSYAIFSLRHIVIDEYRYYMKQKNNKSRIMIFKK